MSTLKQTKSNPSASPLRLFATFSASRCKNNFIYFSKDFSLVDRLGKSIKSSISFCYFCLRTRNKLPNSRPVPSQVRENGFPENGRFDWFREGPGLPLSALLLHSLSRLNCREGPRKLFFPSPQKFHELLTFFFLLSKLAAEPEPRSIFINAFKTRKLPSLPARPTTRLSFLRKKKAQEVWKNRFGSPFDTHEEGAMRKEAKSFTIKIHKIL